MPPSEHPISSNTRRWPGWLIFTGFALFCLLFMLLLYWQLPVPQPIPTNPIATQPVPK